MSEYISKRELIDFSNEEMKQDRPDDLKIRNIHRYIDDAMVDEKEIIRKAFERVIEQLNGLMPIQFNGFGKTLITVEDVIKILKEECGINE